MLALTLILIPVSGCIHNKSLRLSKGAPSDIRVVPVRGQPIAVMSENIALAVVGTLVGGVGGGVAANAANQGATADKRATLTGRLNEDAVNFKPEMILAEECVKLLKASAKPRFRSLSVRAEPLDLPGRGELIQGETQPFKSKNPRAFDWHLRVRDWLKTAPTADYAKAASEGQPGLTVETMFSVVRLINAKTFEMDVAIRVVDSAQAKIIGSRYTMVRKKITPITRDSDFGDFAEDFRRCANEAARECLKQLKLL
jgi:hypothetical protein